MTLRNFARYSLSGESMKTFVRHSAFLVLSGLMLSPLSLAHASPSQASSSQIATLEGHQRWVNSVSFPSAGTLLASGSFDNEIRLWDVARRRHIATLEGHTSRVWSVSLSPDGALLASGSSDGTIKLWDVASRQEIATLTGSNSVFAAVLAVAFSPDGTMLASGADGPDGTIKLWDVARRKEIATLEGHTDWIWSVSFSPNGGLLASGSADGTIKLWDVARRREIATLEGHTGWVQSVAFSFDGALLASGSDDNTIKLWDVVNRQEIATFAEHTDFVNSVSFSPNGRLLASGSSDGTIKLWDVADRQEIATLGVNVSEVRSVSFSPDEGLLAFGLADGKIALWDVSEWVRFSSEQITPQTLTKVSGDGQEGRVGQPLAEPFVVSVLDQNGSIFAGAVITFSVTAGGGTLSSTTTTTDTNGRARSTLTLGDDRGINIVTATVEGLEPLTFTAEQPTTLVALDGISSSHDSVREDDGSVTIALTVTLEKSAGFGGETVSLAIVSPTQGKTAKRGEDFDTTLPETLTIAGGQRTGTAQFTLTPKDNTTADGDRAFAVEATSLSGHQALINIKIIDDEIAGEADDGEVDGEADGEADGEVDGEADGEADGEMDFAFAGAVENQVYTAGTAITALVLPEATGGEGEVTYRVFDLPAGLAFDAATRTISGTPEAATDGAVEVACLAQDSAGRGITLTFSITVNPPLSFGDFFDLLDDDGG